MASRGRKPQTKAQKEAKGETRPSRTGAAQTVVDFPAVEKPPRPPTWLKLKASKDLWNELVGKLMGQRVLTDVDLYALGHLCQLHGRIVDGYRRQVTPTAAELSQLRMYFSEFGLTPSSRSRVEPKFGPSGDGKGNRFGRHGKPPSPAD